MIKTGFLRVALMGYWVVCLFCGDSTFFLPLQDDGVGGW